MTAAGAVVVRARAYERAARATAARALGVDPASVRVDVRDARGRLGVRVDAPLASSAGATLAAAREARVRIARELEQLTGARLAPVELRLTGVRASTGRRVA